jgi:hypothetical protein
MVVVKLSLYYVSIVLSKNACQSIADNNVLRILKHLRNAEAGADNSSNVARNPPTAAVAAAAVSSAKVPAWQEMSRKLMGRLNAADESVPEAFMPEQSTPAPPANQQRKKN